MIIRMNQRDFEQHEMDAGTIEIGGVYTVSEYFNVNRPHEKWHRLTPGDNGGVPGNSNPSIRRYHGWRGTTNDIAKYACGVRRILKIEQYKNGNVKITLGDDLKAGEE